MTSNDEIVTAIHEVRSEVRSIRTRMETHFEADEKALDKVATSLVHAHDRIDGTHERVNKIERKQNWMIGIVTGATAVASAVVTLAKKSTTLWS